MKHPCSINTERVTEMLSLMSGSLLVLQRMTSTLRKQERTKEQRKGCVRHSAVGTGGSLVMGSEPRDTEYKEAEPAAVFGYKGEDSITTTLRSKEKRRNNG